jgi:hypothetical protein
LAQIAKQETEINLVGISFGMFVAFLTFPIVRAGNTQTLDWNFTFENISAGAETTTSDFGFHFRQSAQILHQHTFNYFKNKKYF